MQIRQIKISPSVTQGDGESHAKAILCNSWWAWKHAHNIELYKRRTPTFSYFSLSLSLSFQFQSYIILIIVMDEA